MDLQTRKIEFVKEFLKLRNEEAVDRLEKLLQIEIKSSEQSYRNTMSVEEFNKRIDKSLKDIQNGDFIEADDLLAEIEKWN